MKQLNTTAIVLSRTNYSEADRILTLLTPQYGKLSLLARGVRRVKSKLAGGIELFSVSEITFVRGRGEVGTLVSARMLRNYGHIVKDLDRTMLGYELIKKVNKVTEDEPEEEFFDLLRDAFEALNIPDIPLPIIRFWFGAQLLRLSGHAPNLRADSKGGKLSEDRVYEFSFEHLAFTEAPGQGHFRAPHIKFLRLAMAGNTAQVLAHVQGSNELTAATAPLVNTMLATYLRV
jgi:DNA repair protein RecO (recombination protein O)